MSLYDIMPRLLPSEILPLSFIIDRERLREVRWNPFGPRSQESWQYMHTGYNNALPYDMPVSQNASFSHMNHSVGSGPLWYPRNAS